MQLVESGNSLSPDQIEAVVKRVNASILRDRRASREMTRKVRFTVHVHACSGTLIIRQQMGDQCHVRLQGLSDCRGLVVCSQILNVPKIASNLNLKLMGDTKI